MKELAEYITKNIVSHPDEVEIKVEESDEILEGDENPPVTVYIKVNEEDKGLVIGREGKTINSIRTILAIKARTKVHLKVE